MTKTLAIASAALAASLSFAAPERAAEIAVSGYGGTSTLTNFPVLVRLSPEGIPGFSYADCDENGADIVFMDAGGAALAREIDVWNTNGESLVWVKVPELASGTRIFLT